METVYSASIPVKGKQNVTMTIQVPKAGYVEENVIRIEERIKNQEPSCDGLYPHEVLVLSYAHRYCDNGNEFPRFWWYTYGIKDVDSVLATLEKRAYIKVGSIADAINMEKLPVIKEELKKRDLKVTGKKADLISRLIEEVNENELACVFRRRPYSLTPEGERILKKYEWIPYIHAHGVDGLNIWNLTEMVQTPPYLKYRDKIWGYLNEQSLKHSMAGNWGLERNTKFRMSEFVAEEGKIKNALDLLCEVVSYDLSGLRNGFDMEYLYIYAEGFFPYDKSSVKMAPGITERIKKHADALGLSREQLYDLLLSRGNYSLSPLQLFAPEESASIVLCEMEGDTEKLEQIYSNAEKRFKKKFGKQIKKP